MIQLSMRYGWVQKSTKISNGFGKDVIGIEKKRNV